MDNSGKSSQCDNLLKKRPDLFSKVLHIKDTYVFSKGYRDDKWWFSPSNKEEFVEVIYRSLAERIKYSRFQDKIILFDKGVSFYDKRIIATLIAKGMKYEDAKRLQKSIKSVYIINDYEEIKFYLESGPYKRGNLDFNNFDDIRYNLYLELNKVLIDKSDYIVIQPNTMDFVTDNIISYILYYNRINSDGISRTRY